MEELLWKIQPGQEKQSKNFLPVLLVLVSRAEKVLVSLVNTTQA